MSMRLIALARQSPCFSVASRFHHLGQGPVSQPLRSSAWKQQRYQHVMNSSQRQQNLLAIGRSHIFPPFCSFLQQKKEDCALQALSACRYSSSDASSSSTPRLDREAVTDLFYQFAQVRNGVKCLDADDTRQLLKGIGERESGCRPEFIQKLFDVADEDNNGVIDVDEFMEHAGIFIGESPARIILIVGGPGSGKGILSRRLEEECNVVHLSSGDLLREEVRLETNIGNQVRDIMSRGELVSSAIIVALMKKRMRDHPGKRVLLDGFPRSLENAHDLVTLCGKPELALHLECDDTVLMERIMHRGASSLPTRSGDEAEDEDEDGGDSGERLRREDDNFRTALERLRTFHKFHHSTLEWLREQHVPIVNLDCSGSPDSVWSQLQAIGRLMRPAVRLPELNNHHKEGTGDANWSGNPSRSEVF